MDRRDAMSQLAGVYVPLPTLFVDPSLEVNLAGMRRHVRFLVDAGIRSGCGSLLAGGGAGEFSTLNTDERLRIAEAVIAAAKMKDQLRGYRIASAPKVLRHFTAAFEPL